jgi:hypothetical protein
MAATLPAKAIVIGGGCPVVFLWINIGGEVCILDDRAMSLVVGSTQQWRLFENQNRKWR